LAEVAGFLLIAFDEILVGLAEDFPVEVADVVAGGVLAVLGEFDAETVKGRTIFAGAGAIMPRASAWEMVVGSRRLVWEGSKGFFNRR
jgi:hypothetical protein